MKSPFEKHTPVAVGGMMAAMTVLMAVFGRLLPSLYPIIAPLPLALAALWCSVPMSLVAGLASSALIALFFGPFSGLNFVCMYMPVATVMGRGVAREWKFGKLFFWSALTTILGTAVVFGIQFAIMGFDVQAVMAGMTSYQDEVMKTAESMGLFQSMQQNGVTEAELRTMMLETIAFVMKIMPSIFVVVLSIEAAASLWLMDFFCNRLQLGVRVKAPMADAILAPAWTLVPFIAAWIGVLLCHRFFDIELLWIVCLNVAIVFAAVYAVDGLSYALKVLRWSALTPLRRFLYLMLALFLGQWLIIMFVFLGVFDTILDYRHIRDKERSSE